jgi:hypothetical protein
MKIEHSSFLNILLKDSTFFERLFSSKSLDEFIKKMKKEDFSKFSFIDEHKFRGDVFEIFAEVFFKIHQGDNRVGIYNYSPVPPREDNGVDGVGLGIDGTPATVQVKFRSDETYLLKERDIKNFPYQSIIEYDVDKNTKTNMLIFTTSAGLHYYTEGNVFKGRIRAITKKEISRMIDNNECFWLAARELISVSKKSLGI